MKRKAFTLIELLVVIAIIAILAAILFPVLSQARESAKNAQLLSQMKQVGTSTAIYVTDNDDIMPPASAICAAAGGNCTVIGEEFGWQDLSQPYMKNWDILNNNKRPLPTGITNIPAGAAGEPQRFKRLQHLGMPARAAVSNAFFATGYFTGTHNANPVPVRYDGIAGFQIIGPDTVVDPLGSMRQRATSLSMGGVENPSRTVMIAESGNFDMWFGITPAGADPLRYVVAWQPASYNAQGAVLYTHAFTTATRPESGILKGYGMTAANFAIPKGRTTYCATDTSARSVDFRRAMYNNTASGTGGTTYAILEGLNPQGF